MAATATYHIGASFLTGQPRTNYSDTDMESNLGRLGGIVRAVYPNSTLARSPHFNQHRVQSYEDYNPEWVNFLNQIKQNQIDFRNIDLVELRAFPAERAEALRNAALGIQI